MPKYKATAYIRLSYTDDHSSESDSVSNQRKLIENFVEHNPDIEVVSEKIDDGYSGIIFDRPAFKEMMQDVTDGNINCVIVKDLSRLGREYIETGRYLRRVFPAYGVRFIAITDSIDTAHDSGDDLTVRFGHWAQDQGAAAAGHEGRQVHRCAYSLRLFESGGRLPPAYHRPCCRRCGAADVPLGFRGRWPQYHRRAAE